LHKEILLECGSFSKTDLVKTFYNLFDQSCYQIFLQQHYIENDLVWTKKVETAPTIFKYLLELSILSSQTGSAVLSKSAIEAFFRSALIVTQSCAYSDYLHRNDFDGGIEILNDGRIQYLSNDHSLIAEKDFFRKMSLLSDKLRPDFSSLELDKKGNIKKVSMVNNAIFYDKEFYQKYNVKFSTVTKVAETIIFSICRKEYGVEEFTQNSLLKKLRNHTSLDKLKIKKALEFLSINQEMLSNNYEFYELFDKLNSVTIRPIVHLFNGKGAKGDTVYLGHTVLFRAILLIFSYLDKGIIPLENVAERWAEEKGPLFEKQMRLTIEKKGFRVIRVTDSPSEVGEIDAVACYEEKGIMLIVEAKAPKFDLSMQKEKLHFMRYNQWCERHDKKMKWARENVPLLLSRLNLGNIEIKEIIGLIVTKVPWYSQFEAPYRVFSFEEFENLLDKLKAD
jgi:hypothetical protein